MRNRAGLIECGNQRIAGDTNFIETNQEGASGGFEGGSQIGARPITAGLQKSACSLNCAVDRTCHDVDAPDWRDELI